MTESFQCRRNCGACCIAPSISSAMPGMPKGKPAGVACIHLDENLLCKLFGKSTRPKVCSHLRPCYEMCGINRSQALDYLTQLEQLTSN
ncbi:MULTISPECIES: YkgJ family cysteine cluster protein [unclassified Gilliamella]|uniref:YkgJ family cysteine cluster protein n=1 Tax=unclassified Gilliamella TaxID=2685620 RepID=UPI001C6A2D10|nr:MULTISPECIES: YkgJ family cysteine cluster protein [unclassified Gilliamella]MCX8597296.1 YkgJ family cysteine cluster protein [Gilliamella sp. B3493]MCX8598923.1 YkgJ family cysteine cluster protein [Gilliamella sp. B3486]MCX8689068.1 YkgJ family cysteine cluster protein [Gilliamella sp. B2973]MCX8704771.1 YkgJ family cysteine cluster protein [Gilliamella sp. B3127]QYN41811.1 YkgJ family cysteine cluster protein [Gilliamella sp. ESL0443]